VFREIARVLKPGGRIGIADIVADDSLTPVERAERGSYVGCIAGALSFAEFESGLRNSGLTDVSLTSTHTVADGMHSVIAKAAKPTSVADAPELVQRELPLASTGCCGDGCGCA
jgi:arsenite methyltransferase